ncbi:hypothetical protein ACROAE_13035 [Shewanella sp. MF05960]|uniref:hypothetical protein n=1 Tax=Shewanella sp. MF05960 TaxID=3434874 RepID=UPI003D7ADB55
MRTLGLRVSPTEVTFCIFDSDENRIINVEEVCIPNALETPEKLKYVRATLLDILREFKVEKAGIRLSEPTARQVSIERVQIEGVIQETFASSTLKAHYQGAITTIASKLQITKTKVKSLIKNEEEYAEVNDWGAFSDKEREAILVAKGALNV